jgi:predicted ATPase/class 3 adenylate cyclase
MAQLPTGTVTFLFSDIEGSTQLLQRLGTDYARVLGEHQALLRAAWAAHDGVEIDTAGDGFFVAFPSAPEAVAAAADATRALADHVWPEDTALRVRIGLHTGTPQLVGDHYVGLDVHRAARIAAAGHGGQALLSPTTRELVAHDLPEGAALRDLGAHRLKDLQHPEQLYQMLLAELPADFPPLKTLDAHPHNLPVQPTPLLGREETLAAVCALLRREGVRLVTLTGPGGIGKTRLAIQVAAELLDDCPDGVWFVRLSRLTDPALVMPTVAQTLGLREQGGTPIAETLREHLRNRRTLLVLDNVEQVVAAAPEVARLLEACPGLRVLATSRIPLRLRGEKTYSVAPLPLAGAREARTPERLAQYAAVALFIERARDAQSDFAVTGANAPAIAEVCARLDGLPLAIELAAARVRLLPPEALLARLSTRLLTGGARDAEERQQTMRATLAWSEDLLSPEERVLFRRLGVFVGGWTLEAAEAVCAAPEGAEPLDTEVLDGLGALVDHSLVQRRDEHSEERFGMLHVVREYALERLEACGEAPALRRAHAAYQVTLAEREQAAVLAATDYAVSIAHYERLASEHDNQWAALAWLREQAEAGRQAGETGHPTAERAGRWQEVEAPAVQGLRLAGALTYPWANHGRLGEGRAWLAAFLALDAQTQGAEGDQAERGVGAASTSRAAEPTTSAPAPDQASIRGRALYAAGVLAHWQGDSAEAVLLLERSLTVAQARVDRWTAFVVLNNLGMACQDQGDLARARDCYEQSVALCRALGDRDFVACPLGNLSELALGTGDLQRAADYGEEALVIARQVHRHTVVAESLTVQALIAWREGQLSPAAAATFAKEALLEHLAMKDERHYSNGLDFCAIMCASQGRAERASRLLGAAAACRERMGMQRRLGVPTAEDIEAAVAPARAALGEAAWAAAFEAGHTMTLEEAIALALEAVRDLTWKG